MTSIVAVLLVWGTLLEIYLTNRIKEQKRRLEKCTKVLVTDSSSGIGCTTYDLTDAAPSKGDLPIGIVIPRNRNNNDSDENLANDSATVATTGDERFSKK